jgi:DNA-binding CsgD family transcriptional regulator
VCELSSMGLLECLSSLLLQLQVLCESIPFPEFQEAALRMVQQFLPFDSAVWASGAVGPCREPLIFSVCLLNQPRDMLASYERVKHQDLAFDRALAQAGTTVNIALQEVTWPPGSKELRAHVERFGMQHTLSTVTHSAVTQLLHAIALYRAAAANPFTEQERMFQQSLVPHLDALCSRSRMRHLEEALQPGLERRHRAAAIVGVNGMLYHADSRFTTLLLSEWPDWRGPALPVELVGKMATGAPMQLRFSRIVVHANAAADLYLLHIREVTPCDKLSQREWDIAHAFGNGMTHKEIARQLGIAPGTVRNHLSTVYEKLKVSNKAELMHSLNIAPR